MEADNRSAPVAPVSTDPDQSPIFIVGCGRSGTTLLRQILNAHPRIYLTHEAFFYTYERHTPNSWTGTQWLEGYLDTFSFRWLGLSKEEVRAAVPEPLPRERVHEAFRAIMKLAAHRHGKVRYGEKSPLDADNIARIGRDFPGARFVYIMRDPRAIVESFTRMPWGSHSLLLCSLGLARGHETVAPHFDRLHVLRLEDLRADPERTLRALLDHLGEPWDDAVLDHVTHAPADDLPPLPWFESATRRPLAPPSGREPGWRRALEPVWIRLIERHNAKAMAHFGYVPAELDEEPSRGARIRAVLSDLPRAMSSIGRRIRAAGRLLNFRSRDPDRRNPQDAFEAHLKANPAAWRHYPDHDLPRVPER